MKISNQRFIQLSSLVVILIIAIIISAFYFRSLNLEIKKVVANTFPSNVRERHIDLDLPVPFNILDTLNKAVVLLEHHDFTEMEILIDKILAIDPNNADAIMLRGLSFAAQGDSDSAQTDFDLALSISPDNVVILNQKIVNYLDNDQLQDASDLIEKTLVIDPNNLSTQFNKGRLLLLQNNFSEAKIIFKSISESATNTQFIARALTLIGAMSESDKYSDEAEKAYRKAIENNSVDLFAKVGLARQLFLAASEQTDDTVVTKIKLDESFRLLETVLKVDPKFTNASLQLASQLISLGNIPFARKVLVRAASVVPSDVTLTEIGKESMNLKLQSLFDIINQTNL